MNYCDFTIEEFFNKFKAVCKNCDKTVILRREDAQVVCGVQEDNTLWQNAIEYSKEYLNWRKHDYPFRTPEQIEQIYDEQCSTCEFFKNQNSCAICECLIKREGQTMNKLAWATTRCPLPNPKWVEEEPEYKIEKPGCGNCPKTIKKNK
jgi:hypothetical protein